MEGVNVAKCSNLYFQTPLLQSTCLSNRFGYDVHLKLENVQPAGSFKIRGISNRCKKAAEEGYTHIVSSSGGNAGLAAAYSGRMLKMPVTVVVPETTPEVMRNRIKEEGASVIVKGKVWDEANSYAMSLTEKPGHFLVHPFDHEDLWEGHATMVHEIAASLPRKPSVVVAAVGGGGLLCGVLKGLHDVGWSDVPVVAMETEGANCLAASIQAGRVVTIPEITSLAKCLGAQTPCEEAYNWTSRHNLISHVVQDKDALNACLNFADDHQMLVSLACGAALSAVYSGILPSLKNQGKLQALTDAVVIVCGGNGVTLKRLQEWRDSVGDFHEVLVDLG
ncbi:serine dehydratase-like [Dendronephthya gigantea]|uniref:serine dehydratase-like n=1 Tax=Dendronephthya gigantea TaxID=151771 RepID=UPI001069D7A1|nr:serine dehydratase-like [Dendronephthya gigantea]